MSPDAVPPPLYRRIADDLIARIRAGELAPGATLPTEHQLCAQHGVSRITVRKALAVLVASHYVLRRRGVGTFVRPTDPRRWTVTLAAALDEVLAPRRFVLVRQALVRPPADVLDFAGWPRDTRARLFEASNHLSDGAPLGHAIFYLPLPMAEDVTGAMIAGFVSPARFVERQFGLRIAHARQQIEAALASGKVARHLHIKAGTPVLRALRVYCDARDVPIYAADCTYHPRHYRLTARLERPPPGRRRPA